MMLPENAQRLLVEEIELFIEFGVVADEREAALALVRKYADNPRALTVLQEFYRVLPEAREEAVVRLAHIDSLGGVTLMVVSTAGHNYGAVVSEGEAIILGEYGKEPVPEELLNYFGHGSNEELLDSYGPVEKMADFGGGTNSEVCPICQVAAGECHLLGCPVEVCPWCDGQLNRCSCRFEMLDVESLESNEQVEAFQDLLEAKGRIPYNAEQKLAYPGSGGGLDR